MPTSESWIGDAAILVQMLSPLTSCELNACFTRLAEQVPRSLQPVDILADVSNAGHIPGDASKLVIHAGLFVEPQLNNVAVIGSSLWASFLEGITSLNSSKPLYFYGSFQEAIYALGLTDTSIM